MRARPHIGAAHLQETLETDLGKDRREVVRPVGQSRPFARHLGQFTLQQRLEIGARDVVIGVAALHEIHRHFERVIDIALEPHAVLEREGQHAGAVGIGMQPDIRPHRSEAVWTIFRKGRICEQRGDERLERQRDAQLRNHIGLARKIEIGLHGRRAEHHVHAHRTDAGHVVRHDRITLLRHDGRLPARPERRHAEIEKADSQVAGDRRHVVEVADELVVRLMNGGERRAGQFELAAGLERDGPPADLVEEADKIATILDRRPAGPGLQPLQKSLDAATTSRPREGYGIDAVEIEGNLLVLGADPEVRRLLDPGFDPRHQFVARPDRGLIAHIARHSILRLW